MARFSAAYQGGAVSARPFLPTHFADAEARRQVVLRAAQRTCPEVVLEALRAQNEDLGPSEARRANLDALGRPGTVAVVSGQQVGLFLGPLYTLYKAAAAIQDARALEAETGVRAVPIFWLQTEDHDFEEVATCEVPRTMEDPLSLTAASTMPDGVAMHHIRFGPDLAGLQQQLTGCLEHLPEAAASLARWAHHYREGATWPGAFAGMIGELFEPEGLLVLDPRDPRLAAAAAPVHRRALADAEAIAARGLERAAALEAAGFGVPIHIREGAPLFFFHPDGLSGPRFRVVPDGDDFRLVGAEDREVTRAALQSALDEHPERFSTSALLRPILQDTFLPTAAYIGGPGEIDYFAQMSPLYEAYDLPMPLIVPRSRFVVVEPWAQRALSRYDLDVEALAKPEAEVMVSLLAPPAVARDVLTERVLARVREELARGTDGLVPAPPRLEKAVEKTEQTIAFAIGKLLDKHDDARAHADRTAAQAVQRLQAGLWPRGAPQERIFSLPYFGAKYGLRAFTEKVLDAVRPFETGLGSLTP